MEKTIFVNMSKRRAGFARVSINLSVGANVGAELEKVMVAAVPAATIAAAAVAAAAVAATARHTPGKAARKRRHAKRAAARAARRAAKRKARKEAAEALASKLTGLSEAVNAQTVDGTKLYGGVKAAVAADAARVAKAARAELSACRSEAEKLLRDWCARAKRWALEFWDWEPYEGLTVVKAVRRFRTLVEAGGMPTVAEVKAVPGCWWHQGDLAEIARRWHRAVAYLAAIRRGRLGALEPWDEKSFWAMARGVRRDLGRSRDARVVIAAIEAAVRVDAIAGANLTWDEYDSARTGSRYLLESGEIADTGFVGVGVWDVADRGRGFWEELLGACGGVLSAEGRRFCRAAAEVSAAIEWDRRETRRRLEEERYLLWGTDEDSDEVSGLVGVHKGRHW